MNTGKRLSLFVFLFGGAAALAQVLLFRELLAMCLGNEMSVGLIFCGWLAGVSAGGAAGGWSLKKFRPSPAHLTAAFAALAAALPCAIFAARSLRAAAGFIQGEVVPFGALCWMAPLALVPVSGLTGLCFAWLCAAAGGSEETAPAATARVYTADAAGSAAGSLLYSLALVLIFRPMTLAALAAVLLCAGAAVLLVRKGNAARWFAAAAGAVFVVFLIYGSGRLDSISRRIQWGGQRVDAVDESPYANLTAITAHGQASLFSNGRLAGTVPEKVTAEFQTHVPLSLVDSPEEVLVAGGGPAMVREALKHGARRVTLVETDPVLIGLRERYLSPRDFSMMHGPHVDEVVTDARQYIFTTTRKFDAVLLQAGEPDTLLANRNYTVEFFEHVKNILRPGGIFSMQIGFQENSMNAWQADLLGTHLRTLSGVFGRPLLVAGGTSGALLISARGSPLNYDPGRAVANYVRLGVRAENFGPELLGEAFDRARAEQALQQRELTGPDIGAYFSAQDKIGYVFGRLEARPGARLNRDFHPVSVYYQMRVSSEYYPGALKRFFARVGNGRGIAAWCIGFWALAAAAGFVSSRSARGKGSSAAPAVAAAGFAGMTAEVCAVFVFQILDGNIYYFIGIIIAAFMAGGVLGSRAARSLIERRAVKPALIACLVLFAATLAAAAFALGNLERGAAGVNGTMYSLGLVFASGILVGAIFPLGAGSRQNRSAAGWMYAADHAGAAAGGLAACMLFVPILGVQNTLLLCAAAVGICALPVLPPVRTK